MADVITRLKVESQQYDQKLKRASDSLNSYFDTVKKGGGTLEYLDEGIEDVIKSLGKMETQASSAKGKLREYTEAITSLTTQYRQMTDAERNSDGGRALARSLDELKKKAADLSDVMSDTKREISNLASDTSFSDGMSMLARSVGSVGSAIVALTGNSENMKAVLMDIAKIQATVQAVDSLTKAFQKQNLVLLKNPYVLAASAVAALGVAIYECAKKADDGVNSMDDYRLSIENLGSAAEIAKYKISDLVNIKVNEAKIISLVDEFNQAFREKTRLENELNNYDSVHQAKTASGAAYEKQQLQNRIDVENTRMVNAQALVKLYSGQNSNINKAYEPTKSAPTPRGGGGGSAKEFVSSMKFEELGAQTMEVTTSMKELQAQLNAYKQQLSTATNQFDYNAAQQGIEETQKRINAQPLAIQLGIDVDSAVELEASINDRIERMRSEIKPLEISVDSSQTVRDVNAITKGAKIASQAIGTIGQAFNAIEDPAAKIAATVAQAIASVALAYADTLAKDQTSKWNVFSFIAAAAAATISMATTIAAIHKQTGYALGGVVGGNSYSGDNVGPVMLDAGEVVLNRAQTYALASQLQSNEQGGRSFTTVSGEQLVIAINNYGRRRGMGELIRI